MAEPQTAAPSRVAAAGQDVLLATKLHVPRHEFLLDEGEPLPLDPRDLDIVRVKKLAVGLVTGRDAQELSC
jgi:hypothetical protein